METNDRTDDGKHHQEDDEIERRWLVFEIDPAVFDGPSRLIDQGYIDGTSDLRVRVVDGVRGELATKVGRGRERKERKPKKPPSLEVSRFLLENTPYVLRKRRFVRDGWEIDRFEDALQGIVLAEFEAATPEESAAVVLPPWITSAVEVTETLSNRQLARIAAGLAGCGPVKIDDLVGRTPSIVLTGASGSGKTGLMKGYLARPDGTYECDTGRFLHCVPEVATIIIHQVGAKPPLDDVAMNREYQRGIYRVQRSFEAVSRLHAKRTGKKALLLDRGTLDGAAYVAGGTAEFEQTMRRARADEYARYDAVLIMAPAPRDVFEREKANNPARYETYEEMLALHERIVAVWKDHPEAVVIDGATWDEKLANARAAVDRVVNR